ncbi:hypothetical protein JXQ31_19765 [candidate division KSB1 bacterium]|nr:hypothetical protein [candidate division KSB1 bacterium]
MNLKDHNVRIDTTDIDGKFCFENIKEGTYHLLVNDTLFVTLDTTIVLNKNLDVKLYASYVELSDYFPLKLNNSWLYHYTYSIHDVNNCVGIDYKQIEGSKKWQVTNIKSEFPYMIYEITETLNTYKLKPEFDDCGCVIKYDSVEVINDNVKFYLKEDNKFNLNALDSADLFFGVKIKRFYTQNTPDTLKVHGFVGDDVKDKNLKIVKDLGMILYNCRIGPSNHYFEIETLELIEARLF